MRLAVSNIAWSPEEDSAAYELLRDLGVEYLEIAPKRLWENPEQVSPEAVAREVHRAGQFGLKIAAFQSILFGRADLLLFGAPAERKALLEFLVRIAEVADSCGGGPIVFGAPKNRIRPDTISVSDAQTISRDFFQNLVERIAGAMSFFCLEPNPAAYGCNFLTHIDEVKAAVMAVGSSKLLMQLDTAECAMNDERTEEVAGSIPHTGHVHVSQPMLDEFSQPWGGHAGVARALHSSTYDRLLSIEMRRSPRGLDAVAEAVRFVKECYGV